MWHFLTDNDRTTRFPLFYFLIYYSDPFGLGEVEITNAMVLADRNVATTARGKEGEVMCLNNC